MKENSANSKSTAGTKPESKLSGETDDLARQMAVDRRNRLLASRDVLTKYLFITNAGGAAASLAFLGQTAGIGLAKLILVPLLFFTIGVILSGLTAYSTFFITMRFVLEIDMAEGEERERRGRISLSIVPSWLCRLTSLSDADLSERLAMMAPWTVPWSFFVFVIGCAIGLLMLALV